MNKHMNVEDFLKVCDQFKLGELITESSHPLTQDLSNIVNKNIGEAVSLLKKVDSSAFDKLSSKIGSLVPLHSSIKETLKENGKVFICGCGATGRLALTIEFIWRRCGPPKLKDNIIGFMAGGDCALISSIENFEDYPEFGSRQLRDLNFSQNDLFIGITEGGETPFVIGATNEATTISKRKSFFLYCNDPNELKRVAKRSQKILSNSKVSAINLEVGPMAITGSTRMQATTVQMISVGACLMHFKDSFEIVKERINDFFIFFESTDISDISKFIFSEANTYRSNEYIFYKVDQNLGITVLTDTTERSPTFSLNPFENSLEKNRDPSLCYLIVSNQNTKEDAWYNLLARYPRTFHWSEVTDLTKIDRLYGFDISEKMIPKRKKYLENKSHIFKIMDSRSSITFDLDSEISSFDTSNLSFLFKHIFLKILLNNMSTNIMGILGRYQGNIMTWVKPSNLKLIDRTIRYIDIITRKNGTIFPYQKIAESLFEYLQNAEYNTSIVMEVSSNLLGYESNLELKK